MVGNLREMGEGVSMLENHVPSLELCKKWKELGGRQDTNFYWRLGWNECWHITHKSDHEDCYPECGKDWVAAPLASEMMEWLPASIKTTEITPRNAWIGVNKEFDNKYLVSYQAKSRMAKYIEREVLDNSLPNALMQMCIARKEEENGKG
jgi:hypothetical protein